MLPFTALFASMLACEYDTQSKLARRSPLPTASDYELGLSRKNLDNQLRFSWPVILRRWKDSLLHWWTFFDLANEALRDLPKHLVDDSSGETPPLDQWSVRLQKLLIELGNGIGHTRKTKQSLEIDLGGAVLYRIADEWRSMLGRLRVFETDLDAIGWLKSSESKTPQRNTPRKNKTPAQWECLLLEFESDQKDDPNLTESSFAEQKNINRTTLVKGFERAREKRLAANAQRLNSTKNTRR